MAKKYYKPPQLDFGGTGTFKYQPNPYLGSGATTGVPTAAPAALPDFGQVLANDPFYQASLANLNAQGVYDKASRDAAIKQATIRFGEVPNVDPNFLPPDLRGEIGGILDPTTRSLAAQNTTAGLSIVARLMDAAKQTNKRTVDVLGSRGLFRSGETGYQLGRNQLGSNQARYDSTNKFLDYLMGVQAAFTAAERQRLALLAQQQADAADRYTPPAPPAPPPDSPHPNPHPYGPGIEPDGSSFPPPPQPTGGPWMPPIDPILDLLKTYRPKGLGGLETQPQ